jgi:hypothetical protein
MLFSVFSLARVFFNVAILPIPITPAADGTGMMVTPEGNYFDIHGRRRSPEGASFRCTNSLEKGSMSGKARRALMFVG